MTSISVLDYYIRLCACTSVNMILGARLVVCTKGFAMCYVNVTWEWIVPIVQKRRVLTLAHSRCSRDWGQ